MSGGGAFGPASSSPPSLEYRRDSVPRASRPAYSLRLRCRTSGLGSQGVWILVTCETRSSDFQRRSERALVKSLDSDFGRAVADDGDRHRTKSARDEIAVSVELNLDISSNEGNAGL